jgi:hypothetical protein
MKLKTTVRTTSTAALLCLILSTAVHAAEPPAPATGDKTTAPAPSAPAARAEPKLSTTAQPRANTSDVRAPAANTAQGQAKTPPAARKTNDRIELDTTVVTGNRELPKVLYIVPWKKADIGDLPAQPFNTLLDEVLTPVDRDVFRREVTYYGAIANGTGAASGEAAAPAGSSRSSEK